MRKHCERSRPQIRRLAGLRHFRVAVRTEKHATADVHPARRQGVAARAAVGAVERAGYLGVGWADVLHDPSLPVWPDPCQKCRT
jgi:hypothetical protein